VNPKSAGAAVAGFGAPLAGGTDESLLDQPMIRGVYAFASLDRKTVLKAMVIPKEEAGFDPQALLNSPLVLQLEAELMNRIRATWNLVQLSFESHDPGVYPALRFLLGIAERLGVLTDGVIADPIAQRYLLPDQLRHSRSPEGVIDARDFVSVQQDRRQADYSVHTLGMQKFQLPELELIGISEQSVPTATRFLEGLCQSVLSGKTLAEGDRVGDARKPLIVAAGGLDRGRWEGIACFELIPEKRASIQESLDAWNSERP